MEAIRYCAIRDEQQMLDENEESFSSERIPLKVLMPCMETGREALRAPGARRVESMSKLVISRNMAAPVQGTGWHWLTSLLGPDSSLVLRRFAW
ncbi:hypothetical protein ROV96_10075 [Stenotrophomonas pavanii]|uniref:hypothetical protein n=1 Tax=Stenotrophomonas pavanii TaxID=487698 RepID=UPI0015F6AFB2|nr:hypothetical protein [Stenotrophomonas pavanii]MDT3464300.1 hypothetical protein [Stenotrophomonas pavanii]